MINCELRKILEPAYPCSGFKNVCNSMRWNPKEGHVPRGFFGATGNPEEVELILVCAEPGDPHDIETHTGLDSAYNYAQFGFGTKKDYFHKNVRHILNLCWPNISFEEQSKKFWLTDSVLCSAATEGGKIEMAIEKECASKYLIPQINLFKNAIVVALGKKADTRMKRIGLKNYLSVASVAPPGCNFKGSKASWEQIPHALNEKRKIQPKA